MSVKEKGNVIPSNRVAVLFSGGIDSTVVLAWLVHQGYEATALHFSYGQPAMAIERRQSELLAKKHGAKRYAPISLDPALFVWQGGYCPSRNLAFIASAAAFAESHNIPNIALGLCQSVENPARAISYPDCTRDFVRAAQDFLDIGSGINIQIIAPFIDFTKSAVIRTAALVGVDISDTFSCLSPDDDVACGNCNACSDKLAALDRIQFSCKL